MSLRIPGLLAFIAAVALLAPGSAVSRPQQNELVGTVGPGFSIRLTKDGQPVKHLDVGEYTITVQDLSAIHNFHLRGPGVDMRTDVQEDNITVVWHVTFVDGVYTFQCDPHAAQGMKGQFAVGTATLPTPKPKAKTQKLTGRVGPGFTISLKKGGKKVKSLKAGTYKLAVRDQSAFHNFHLVGPGVNKKTRVAFRGTVTWTVRLRKGKKYSYRCDPHARNMKGSLRAT